MGIAQSKLTVLFEDPFWIGLYERTENMRYEVCKITFGAEPRDYEVYDFILKNWSGLRFSPSVAAATAAERRINPKRLQREIKRQTGESGVGTKAQQALKLQQEQGKQARKVTSREQREEEAERQYSLHQEKRREKHRGH